MFPKLLQIVFENATNKAREFSLIFIRVIERQCHKVFTQP